MEQIILPSVVEEAIDNHSSKFTIAPLFPGYGYTVGNSLRRVLLSSLPGAAVTSFKIDGIDHEFSTIPGVKEDAVEIMLNLKSLHVTMHETEEPVTLSLHAKGPANVTAGDFTPNSKLTISNPDLVIATLSSKAKLDLEVVIEYGRGYDPIEKRDTKSQALGVIAVDSLFTPVTAVSLEVDNTRVGKMTNYDALYLIVSTNGTVSPSEALKAASAILVDQFNLLANYDQVQAATTEVVPDTTGEAPLASGQLQEAGLSPRIAKILNDNGISTLEAVKNLTDDQLKSISGLGPKAISEINKFRA